MISGRETPAKEKQWKGRISRVSMNNKNKKKKEVNLTNESSHQIYCIRLFDDAAGTNELCTVLYSCEEKLMS